MKNAGARYSRRRFVVKKKSSQARAAAVENVLKSCERYLLNPPTILTPGLSTEIFVSVCWTTRPAPETGDTRQSASAMTCSNDPSYDAMRMHVHVRKWILNGVSPEPETSSSEVSRTHLDGRQRPHMEAL